MSGTRARVGFLQPILLVVVLFALAAGSLPAAFKITDPTGIYYGDPDTFRAPAVLSTSLIFDQIPEYQEIKEKGLDESDPEYWILLEKANRRFYAAVAATARALRQDLVAETGAVIGTDGESIPNITQQVIRRVKD